MTACASYLRCRPNTEDCMNDEVDTALCRGSCCAWMYDEIDAKIRGNIQCILT
jgi:hypothetical protein